MEERLEFCYIDSMMTGKRSALSSIMRFQNTREKICFLREEDHRLLAKDEESEWQTLTGRQLWDDAFKDLRK